jgi:hypothetical protein
VEVLIIVGVLAAISAGVIAVVCWLTKRISPLWLRALVRAMGAAAVTPVLVPASGIHGALPLPAFWGVPQLFPLRSSDWLWIAFAEMSIVLIVAWAVAYVFSFERTRKRRSA